MPASNCLLRRSRKGGPLQLYKDVELNRMWQRDVEVILDLNASQTHFVRQLHGNETCRHQEQAHKWLREGQEMSLCFRIVERTVSFYVAIL